MTQVEHSYPSSKATLRTQIRAQRAQRPQHEREAFAERLVSAATVAPLSDAHTVTLFVGVGDEPDTRPLITALHQRGIRVLLPIVNEDWSLNWAEYTGADDLVPAGYGLLEPAGLRLGMAAIAEADVVVVPALAIDADGRRLGQGAGCYDRALVFVPVGTPVLAVVYEDESLAESLPEAPHDRRVSAALLPPSPKE